MSDPNGIDVVVPLGRGSNYRNVELRYFLRSLEKYAKGFRRVIILGENPKFLSTRRAEYHPIRQFPFGKATRIALKTLWAFENLDLTEEVLFCNDDYVFVKSFDVRKVPNYQRGDLFERSQIQLRQVPPGQVWQPDPYQKLLRETAEALKAAGKPTLDYDLHVPNIYRKTEFLSLKPWWEKSKTYKVGLVVKSVYGNNIFPTPGPRLRDLKLGKWRSHQHLLAAVHDRFVFSYGDAALESGLETSLFKMFPNFSSFEKESDSIF
jgi:hypothetical protein